jgi:hypothetical protein
MYGADPIPGFTWIEQGGGYLNCYHSLYLLQYMDDGCNRSCPRKGKGLGWRSPLDLLDLDHGRIVLEDVTIEPGKFEYFSFWSGDHVDAIRITLSGMNFAPWEEQNPGFGDSGYIYLSSAARDGIDDYLINTYYYDVGPGPDTWIYQVSSDFAMQPGVLRLVFEGDWWSYNDITIDEVIIEVVDIKAFKLWKWLGIWNKGVDVDEAQVAIHDGSIYKFKGKVKEGETDVYAFTIPDVGHPQMAIVELSWRRDWTRWATSDLDIIIFGPGGYFNVDGATGASPEVTAISEPGDYTILVDGYQVYFNKKERYRLRIIYFADLVPKWESEIIALDCWITFVRLPRCMKGVAIVWIHDTLFNYWYMADYVKV